MYPDHPNDIKPVQPQEREGGLGQTNYVTVVAPQPIGSNTPAPRSGNKWIMLVVIALIFVGVAAVGGILWQRTSNLKEAERRAEQAKIKEQEADLKQAGLALSTPAQFSDKATVTASQKIDGWVELPAENGLATSGNPATSELLQYGFLPGQSTTCNSDSSCSAVYIESFLQSFTNKPGVAAFKRVSTAEKSLAVQNSSLVNVVHATVEYTQHNVPKIMHLLVRMTKSNGVVVIYSRDTHAKDTLDSIVSQLIIKGAA